MNPRWQQTILARLSIRRKFEVVLLLFVVMVVALSGVGNFALDALSSVRAYVGGEGLYSKSQKRAVNHLVHYALSFDEDEYAAYAEALEVPLGDKAARLELEKDDADLDVADRAFVRGRNRPADVRGMSVLFRRFRRLSYLDRAIGLWAEADGLIAEMQREGEALRERHRVGDVGAEEVAAFVRRVDALDARLTVLEDGFSFVLGDAARWMKGVLALTSLALALSFLAIGLVVASAVSRNVVEGIVRLRLGAARVGLGELSGRIAIESNDELGQLAVAFNKMIDGLVVALAERKRGEEELVRRVTQIGDAREALTASLGEKEVLLREIHHRVKNNLQVISSLLKLHGDKVTDPVARSAFDDSQARVQSIALLHEQLYQSEDLGSVDMGEYAESLARTLLRTHGAVAPAKVRVDGAAVSLPVDLAVPCGLILNELVTNALKHAFPGDAAREATIEIAMSVDTDDLELTVRDNGVGLPADFDLHAKRTLGMYLVRTLARQLHAELSVAHEGGTRWVLRFPRTLVTGI